MTGFFSWNHMYKVIFTNKRNSLGNAWVKLTIHETDQACTWWKEHLSLKLWTKNTQLLYHAVIWQNNCSHFLLYFTFNQMLKIVKKGIATDCVIIKCNNAICSNITWTWYIYGCLNLLDAWSIWYYQEISSKLLLIGQVFSADQVWGPEMGSIVLFYHKCLGVSMHCIEMSMHCIEMILEIKSLDTVIGVIRE